MTVEEFLALPDREKDALVAEKVMGGHWLERTENIRLAGGCYDDIIVEWSPSTDISDAWEVVRRLTADGLRPNVMPDWVGSWQCVIYRREEYICQSEFYRDPQSAIIVAALYAKGVIAR